MLRCFLLFGMLTALGGCGGAEDGAHEVPVSKRPTTPVESDSKAATKPARAIATH
jgi:hypothetical protein